MSVDSIETLDDVIQINNETSYQPDKEEETFMDSSWREKTWNEILSDLTEGDLIKADLNPEKVTPEHYFGYENGFRFCNQAFEELEKSGYLNINEIINSGEELPPLVLENISNIFYMWNISHNAVMDMWENSYEKTKPYLWATWNNEASILQNNLIEIFGDTLSNDLENKFELYSDQKDFDKLKTDINNYLNTVDYLFNNEVVPGSMENLTRFLMLEGYKAKATFHLWDSKRDNLEEVSEDWDQKKRFYEYVKFNINESLSQMCLQYARESNSELVREIIQHLAFSEIPQYDYDENEKESLKKGLSSATKILLHENLNFNHRKTVCAQYMRVFGVMDAVDALSLKIDELEKQVVEGGDWYLKQLKDLYNLIEGESVNTVAPSLEEVYEKTGYALNEREALTEFESGIIGGIALEILRKNKGDVKILELGAGNARLSRRLSKQGYTNLTALDIDPGNLKIAKERSDGKINLVLSSWDNLPFPSSETISDKHNEKSGFDLIFTTERSFLHNREVSKWINLFNESNRVMTYGGCLVFDLPDTEKGSYKVNRDRIRKNLEDNFGIERKNSGILFDGPGTVKFNRMLITEEQLGIYAKLFGFQIVKKIEGLKLDEDTQNNYYVLQKDQDFDIGKLPEGDILSSLEKLGLYEDFTTNFNNYIDSWGMTLGQLYLFGAGGKKLWEGNKGPYVFTSLRGDSFGLETF